jgi:hypothetical protein
MHTRKLLNSVGEGVIATLESRYPGDSSRGSSHDDDRSISAAAHVDHRPQWNPRIVQTAFGQFPPRLSNRKNLFQLGGDSWTLTVNVWGMLIRNPIPYRRLYGAPRRRKRSALFARVRS